MNMFSSGICSVQSSEEILRVGQKEVDQYYNVTYYNLTMLNTTEYFSIIKIDCGCSFNIFTTENFSIVNINWDSDDR